uniref:Secreted protein n=1 Tax=Opuntia streptacantha TaxID=393608 RepID=A0A7C9EM64_OPUST
MHVFSFNNLGFLFLLQFFPPLCIQAIQKSDSGIISYVSQRLQLLLLCKIIRQTEYLTYLLRSFPFNHARKCTACQFNQRLQLQAVSSRGQLAESFCTHSNELFIKGFPLLVRMSWNLMKAAIIENQA